MKTFIMTILSFMSFFLMSAATLANTHYVSVNSDHGHGSHGELRFIMQAACDTPGDDVVTFAEARDAEFRIVLRSPLVIPLDCQGTIEFRGRNIEAILDGSNIDGGGEPYENCILTVYSQDNIIRDLTFVNHDDGAGICVFGKNTTLDDVRVGVHADRRVEPIVMVL